MIGRMHERDWSALAKDIKAWGRELGFDAVGIAGTDLAAAEPGLAAWLAAGFHGAMDYMQAHGMKRARPAELQPGTRSVIVARINYLPAIERAATPVSRYALGRDYHKLVRQRLQKLAERIETAIGPFEHRAFTDSAPLLEVELATRAGLGWRGKHTLLLSREAGSWFFLGELLTDLPLPPDTPVTDHCGTCTACIDACPTAAIIAPGRLDARRCISYLTIELKDAIPEALRAAMGTHIYGCDDCQLCCPWNRTAPLTRETDFGVRLGLDAASLVELFAWTTEEFDGRLAGSPIRRIGHERWLRNIAVALGNALQETRDSAVAAELITALRSRADDPSALVREHVAWALAAQPGSAPVATGRAESAHHSLQEPG
jgi:epoxyqueuosine reductase